MNFLICYNILCCIVSLKKNSSIVIFVLRLEEQGVTLNDDLIIKK